MSDKWEYKTMIDVEMNIAPGENATYRINFSEGALNKMGQEGWELAAVHGKALIFKRPLAVSPISKMSQPEPRGTRR